MFAACVDDPLVKLVSVMDHTPGQRQFAKIDIYRTYYKQRYGLDDAAVDAMIGRQKQAHATYSARHRRIIVDTCRERSMPLASHDDACEAHVAEAAHDGMIIAEFPTTMEAARAARTYGLGVLMGAPNVVLGGSHSGNVSALSMAETGLLDILSSDYVPSSMLYAAFLLANDGGGMSLPEAVRLISSEPAECIGFDDRGEIAPGKRADLIRVRHGAARVPTVMAAWCQGERVG
jgi:alpha-D-ribose 1-methylphosphonate 5-triphosphate diphosphatase